MASKRRAEPFPELKKGMLLIVKAPPYYTKEYVYEVLSAGKTMVRAGLHHSPTVRKQYTHEELAVFFSTGIIRIASEQDISALNETQKHSQ